MKKFAILATVLAVLAACSPQPKPIASSDGPTDEPVGVIFTDPATGNDVFINDGSGLFF